MWDKTLLLFISFLQIGTVSIGGGYAAIPLIQEQAVEINHWLTYREFTDIITISQMTPGPLTINTSSFVGIRIAGLSGLLAATFGSSISGIVISMSVYRLFVKYRHNKNVIVILKGLQAISIGLIASAAATILLIAAIGSSQLTNTQTPINWTAVILCSVFLFILRKFHLNPILLMTFSGAIGAFLY